MDIAKILFLLCIGVSFGALAVGCSSEPPSPKVIYQSLSDVPSNSWNKLQGSRIFFAHQSVGENILDGIENLKAENPQIKIKVAALESPKAISPGTLGHTRIGKNRDPEMKIDKFKEWLSNGVGQRVDVAFLKLCFLDIDANTDVTQLFEYYQKNMADLKKQFPHIRFIHFTVPLTVSKTSWKTYIKKLMGKTDLWEYADNIKRNAYNALLLETYQDKELVFDIAAIEATRSDGKSMTFSLQDKVYYSLNPAYTPDGGHLNDKGSHRVADALLALLASLA